MFLSLPPPPAPHRDVFRLLWALCGVRMWNIKRVKDKFNVCEDNAAPPPLNWNNTTYEMRLFSIFVTLLIRKINGFVVKTRERDSEGFSSFPSLAIGSLWVPELSMTCSVPQIQNKDGSFLSSRFWESL